MLLPRAHRLDTPLVLFPHGHQGKGPAVGRVDVGTGQLLDSYRGYKAMSAALGISRKTIGRRIKSRYCQDGTLTVLLANADAGKHASGEGG